MGVKPFPAIRWGILWFCAPKAGVRAGGQSRLARAGYCGGDGADGAAGSN